MNDSDWPLCMQPGFDPETPGKEYEERMLNAFISEGITPEEWQ